MYTNKMRYTGTSGVDTQSMIDQLMKAESMKLYKYQKSTQLLSWKQDAYRANAEKLKTFQSDFFNFTSGVNMRMEAAYTNFKAVVPKDADGKENTNITVTNTSGAASGNYKLEVLQLAQSDKYMSQSVSGAIQSLADIDVSNFKADDAFSVNLDGATKSISLSSGDLTTMNAASDKIAKLAEILNDKLKTAFGTELVGGITTNKVSVSNTGNKISFNSPIGHDLKILEGKGRDTKVVSNVDFAKPTADKTYGFSVESASGTKNVSVDIKEDMTATQYVNAINSALTKAEVTNMKASYEYVDGKERIVFSGIGTDEDLKIKETSNSMLSDLGFGTNEITVKHTNVMADFKIKSGTAAGVNLNQTISEAFNVTGTVNFNINGTDFSFNSASDSVKSLLDKVNNSSANVKMKYDNVRREFSLESNAPGEANKIKITGTNANFDSIFGFTNKQAAQDAIFKLNDVQTTRSSNNISMNGLNVQLNKAEAGKIIEVNVSGDTTTTVDNIKKFIEGYNKLIEGLNTNVREVKLRNSSGVAYQPLTDDEKKEMKADEIKLWEDKAKEGILGRDDILGSVLSNLRSYAYESVDVGGGKKMSMYDIGITTSNNYSDGGKLVIDEKKLRKALEEFPDDVTKLFTKSSDVTYADKANAKTRMKEQGFSERINDILNNAVGSSGSIAKRAGFKGETSEKSNELYTQLSDQITKMETMRKSLAAKEEYYYQMFSKMEVAMNQSNSQMTYLQQQFGG